jgi:hypothetical protein
MNKVLLHHILKLLILVSFLAISTNVFAEQINTKYQTLFYPNGMPAKEGPLGTGPTVYHFYNEASMPEKNLLFVLYSVNIPSADFYSDYSYTAYLAVVNNTSPTPTIIATTDVTNYMTNSIDECDGCFALMDGNLDILPLINDKRILHLNIGSVLSGTGGVSSSSDVFFLVDTTNYSLIPALELLNTTTFVRGGEDFEKYSDTFLYMEVDNTVGTKIFSQKYNYEFDRNASISNSILDPNISVYTFNFNSNKYLLSATTTALPADAKAINKSFGKHYKYKRLQ